MTIITEGELRLLAAESAIQVALTGLGDIRTRITTLEARCLENERRETASRWWSETRQAPSPVDDHRGKERPVKPPPELVRCAAWETCDDPHCNGHKGLHSRRSVCVEPCHGGTICIPVLAQEPKLSEQWRCPAVNCYHHYGAAWCRHGKDHEWRHDCAEFCCCNTCQPAPNPRQGVYQIGYLKGVKTMSPIRTLDEACRLPGITRIEKRPDIPEGASISIPNADYSGLRLHFSSLPNWYGGITGFDCPICGIEINWEWLWRDGKAPSITGADTPLRGGPVIMGGYLRGYGHRWIHLICVKCHTPLFAENFD